MKKPLALAAAIGSALYLLFAGPMPDPIPLFDEALMLWIFVSSMKSLGFDVTKWLPFLSKKSKPAPSGPKARDTTIDV